MQNNLSDSQCVGFLISHRVNLLLFFFSICNINIDPYLYPLNSTSYLSFCIRIIWKLKTRNFLSKKCHLAMTKQFFAGKFVFFFFWKLWIILSRNNLFASTQLNLRNCLTYSEQSHNFHCIKEKLFLIWKRLHAFILKWWNNIWNLDNT